MPYSDRYSNHVNLQCKRQPDEQFIAIDYNRSKSNYFKAATVSPAKIEANLVRSIEHCYHDGNASRFVKLG